MGSIDCVVAIFETFNHWRFHIEMTDIKNNMKILKVSDRYFNFYQF